MTPWARDVRRDGPARLALPYLALAALVLVDVLTGREEPFAGTFGVAGVVAAVLSGPRVTAAVAVVATSTAVVMSVWETTSLQAATTRVVIVAGIGAAAVALSAYERRRDADYRQVLLVAEAAQRAVLRPVPAQAAGVELAARYLSASRLAEVGGDFYEVVRHGGGARLVVGDVRGKGLDSVALAAVALGVFREAAAGEPTLAAVAHRFDARLGEYLGEEDFVTALLGELVPSPAGEEPVLRLVSCGHPPPLLVRAGGVTEVPVRHHPALGLADVARADHAGEPTEVRLRGGDRVLLYTDGLVEARDPDRGFVPLQRLTPALLPPREACESAEVALARLLERLRDATGGTTGDDLALLLLQRPVGARPA